MTIYIDKIRWLPYITIIIMVYGTQITIVTGAFVNHDYHILPLLLPLLYYL